MLGNGDGSFKPAVPTFVGSATGILRNATNFIFDDMNNDGKIDLISEFGVMLGNGDGTFQAANPFPLSPPPSPGSPPAGTPPLPSGPALAVGDFDGDGTLDVAVPSPTTTGSVNILLGRGNGTFTNQGPVVIAAGSTISALDAEDIDGDGNIDLLAGVTTPAGASSIALLSGNGSGGFAAPALFTVSGPPVSISSADFNSDGNLDLLSINAGAGTGQGTTGFIPATAEVLLNTKATPLTPTVTLGASARRVVVGTQVKLVVAVQAPPAPLPVGGKIPSFKPQPIPTGNVTFNNGSTPLGTVALKNGRATFTMTAAGLGVQQITAAYSGDATYAAATSSPITQTVLLTSAGTPLLSPSLTTATLPALFLPKDPGTVSIQLTNGGGGSAIGKISINFYLSATGIIDASSIAIPAPTLQNRAISIASGRTTTLTAHFKVGTYPPGSYKIIAQIVPVTGITTDELTQSTLVSTSSFQAAGMVFGTVGAHKGLTLALTDDAGNRATLSLAGGGVGTVTQSAAGTDITLSGTSASSQFSIVVRGSTFSFDAININGAIGTLNARAVSLTGSLTLKASANAITFASIGSPAGAAVPITIGSGSSPALSLGIVSNATLTSASTIRSLMATTWQGGQIVAPAITTLSVKGIFDPTVLIRAGGKIQSATLGTIDGGLWALPNGIGILRINGDLFNASIYAGADAGPDLILGTADDRYSVATITSLIVGGNVTSSLIAAGAAPLPGGNIFAGITLLPKAAIRSIQLRGQLSDDSHILAAVIPAKVKIAGSFIANASDPRFMV
jgi:hypothetical protein